jgi:hypothetical protein
VGDQWLYEKKLRSIGLVQLKLSEHSRTIYAYVNGSPVGYARISDLTKGELILRGMVGARVLSRSRSIRRVFKCDAVLAIVISHKLERGPKGD